MPKVGILQVNPQTFWKRGGGEIHAEKYLNLLPNFGFEAEKFDFNEAHFYDIVHIFGANPQLSEWGRYAMKEGIKVVCTPILFPSGNILKYRAFLKLGEFLPFPTTLELRKKLLQDCHHLIANTGAEKTYLSRAYGIREDKISVIGTGVDASVTKWQPNGQLPARLPNNYVLMVGRVTPLKGQARVMKLLENTDFNLVLCGPPDLYEAAYIKEIRDLIDKNPDRFFWIEGLPSGSDDLKNLYASSMCHLLFSDTDVAPLVNMEAAALGTIVCSRPHITVKEILGDLAVYADEHNLCHKLEEIRNLDPEKRKSLTSRLRLHIRQHYTWEKIAEDTAAIYADLLR